MNRRAIACFDLALADVGSASDDTLRQVLHDYFAWATTTTVSRYHRSAEDVPNGLSIPHWSWNGLVATEQEQSMGTDENSQICTVQECPRDSAFLHRQCTV
jgi:hypothetical protein